MAERLWIHFHNHTILNQEFRNNFVKKAEYILSGLSDRDVAYVVKNLQEYIKYCRIGDKGKIPKYINSRKTSDDMYVEYNDISHMYSIESMTNFQSCYQYWVSINKCLSIPLYTKFSNFDLHKAILLSRQIKKILHMREKSIKNENKKGHYCNYGQCFIQKIKPRENEIMNCCICMEDKYTIDTLKLSCKHSFCKECFRGFKNYRTTDVWSSSKPSYSCPLCRRDGDQIKIYQVKKPYIRSVTHTPSNSKQYVSKKKLRPSIW